MLPSRPNPPAIQQHRQANEDFLAQARQELADGDLAQASEKGWCATAQILKGLTAQEPAAGTAGNGNGPSPSWTPLTQSQCHTAVLPVASPLPSPPARG